MATDFYLSYKWLYWTRPSAPPAALPEGIERTFVKTPGGDIELLSAKPARPTSATPPVVFAHGGMGCAWMWTPYMTYLKERGITSYAVSMRGHGESWCPSFIRMVYMTTKRMVGDDLVAAIQAVERTEGRHVVLVGHSGGGGLAQFLVNEGDVQVTGLALLDAMPGNGSYRVYYNWWCFDPWLFVRLIFHGWHPNSPLSHPSLTKKAFFSKEYPEANVTEFQHHLSRYESLLWPLGMLNSFVDARRLLNNITGWGTGGDRVLIMSGTGDKLMTEDIQRRMAGIYRDAFSDMVGDKRSDDRVEEITRLEGEGGMDDTGCGVRLAFVPGAGHHVQNDVQWKTGAEKLVAFLQQL